MNHVTPTGAKNSFENVFLQRCRSALAAAFLEPPIWNCYVAVEFMFCANTQQLTNLMPHPDRASESILGSDDGKWIFESVIASLQNKSAAKAA